MAKKTKDEKIESKKDIRCSKCGRYIKNVNRKFDVKWHNGIDTHCCSKECFEELSTYHKKHDREKMAFIAQIIFGVAGILAVLMQHNVAGQIFIIIDAILFLVFPHAVFNPKLRPSYDEAKRQSRNIGVSLLMFAVIWFYFLYKKMGI